jgi:hypothetical protein
MWQLAHDTLTFEKPETPSMLHAMPEIDEPT